ncbi:amylo-alpha-1,6-glucosidase [Acuticoccus sediminis]|uniref:Amylo-alpha-1,6-glucosidase n=1 Tax=Acuticoccus sediminis TaxID=2184697 RepID=A0A8B2NJE1_9HYPH|nr:amylo-alpha-1,6-glucosidase [Acuticoccus sediminis]RAH95763.1 amylo-alpha-1,6-glucosidase [Acuticoccus sediminis]
MVVPSTAPLADVDPTTYEAEPTISLVGRALRNLKDGESFVVLDSHGDLGTIPGTAEGLFFRDTRHLSRMELRLEGQGLLLLNSETHDDKAALSVDLTNPMLDGAAHVPPETIFFERTMFLWSAVWYERLSIRNFTSIGHRLTLDYRFDADFHDLFEVRGNKRKTRSPTSVEVTAHDRVEFYCLGLDNVARRTTIGFAPAPRTLEGNRATFDIALGAGEKTSLFVTVACDERASATLMDFFRAYRESCRARRALTADIVTVESSNELFNEVACRATSDIYTLITSTNLGPYPYAGIPWFSTVFGRDGIFTAMFMLWVDPMMARGVLRTLAATQATETDPRSDAQPGKILHEMRHGEMANLGEVPFRRYYGSVDVTPLFVMLAGMYLDATGDLETVAALWPNIQAALRWIDEYGDQDGDGFVEYSPASAGSLKNQGWKDSHDSIFHADGTGAEGPIALCEVQGYAFAAKRLAARLAMRLGHEEVAASLDASAETLRVRFEEAFWDDDLSTYVLALDGAKRPCRVRASNAGHALFTGIAAPERARRVADGLMGRSGFSGWGIRTLAQGEARYNPMSYHNGSVWPHDNAIIAIGFARYGYKAETIRVFEGLFDAAKNQELRRLPELFCGFMRRPRRSPAPYPVACSPQAWAASAVFGLLGAGLGLELAHASNEFRFREPLMPVFLDELVLRNLKLGSTRVDIRMHRYGHDVATTVLERRGHAKILVIK